MDKNLMEKFILITAVCLIAAACGPEQIIPTSTKVPESTKVSSTVTPELEITLAPTMAPTNVTQSLLLKEDAFKIEIIGRFMTREQVQQLDTLESLPFVEWEKFEDVRFLYMLQNLSITDQLPDFASPEEVIPLTADNGIISRVDTPLIPFEERHGWGNLWTYDAKWKYQNPNAMPWRPLVYRSEFQGAPVVKIIYAIRNSDGTDGFVDFIFDPADLNHLKDILGATYTIVPTGIRIVRKEQGVEFPQTLGLTKEIVWDWYQQQVPFYRAFLQEWQEDGILSNTPVIVDGEKVEKLPIIMAQWSQIR